MRTKKHHPDVIVTHPGKSKLSVSGAYRKCLWTQLPTTEWQMECNHRPL